MTDPTQLIGQQVGQYEIKQHIARGGMADVYLAHDSDLNRKVALKIMLPVLAADSQFVERFRREAQTAAQLDHPHIVQVYGIGVTPTHQPYIAMQYIEGGSLQATLERVAARGELVGTRQALAIIGEMADALHVAHNAGIIHRDIKPSNILIRLDGAPVLVDLGIAAVAGGPKLTQTGTLIGTPHYMSPEQASGKPLDGRSDIYSLGIILYELLSGRRPFEAEDPLAVLHKQVYEEPVPLHNLQPDLSPQTGDVVHRAMQKDPDYRFPTAADLRQAIHQAIQAEGGTGVMTPAGVWRPQPTDDYRLSTSKIVRPSILATGEARPRRAWPYALLPAILFFLLLAAYRFVPTLSFFSNGSRPTPTVDGANEPITTSTPAGPDENRVAVAVPTSTFVPLPTLTPLPTTTATATAMPTLTPDLGPETTVIGHSVRNVPLEAVRFGAGANKIIFIGGLHAGFAPATVTLAQQAIVYFSDNQQEIPAAVTLYVIANANPDSQPGVGQLSGRLNANNVDLNRNWDCRWSQDARWRNEVIPGSGGPAPFSEPETQALANFIVDNAPAAVVFWEARASLGLSTPGACETRSQASEPLAQIYGLAAGYQIADFETLTDQELNGDGTNWLDQLGIPAIAILLPDYDDMDWNNNLAGMLAVLRDPS
jgi:serine/threonine-protein kinase